MVNLLQEKAYIESMLIELQQAINNASRFGDEITINCIRSQIESYQRRLDQINNQLIDDKECV